MADNAITVADANATLAAGTVISTEEVTTLNGGAVTAQHVQRLFTAVRTADGTAVDVTAAAPLPVTMAIPSGAATAAAQATGNAALASILSAVDGLEGVDYATQTTLAAILAKLIAAPSTEAKQDTGNTSLASLVSLLTTQAGYLDNVEGLLTAQALYLDGLETLIAAQATLAQTQPVSLATVPSHAVTNAGTFAVQNTPAVVATATTTQPASSATVVTILASNASRKQAMIYNDSTQILYLKFGATATTTDHTVQMAAASYYELPAPVFTGILTGLWASANGSARVTELT